MVTIYVDASRPNDTGNGLSEATAKRTPRAAQLAAAAGDRILLKTGYCYDPVNGNFLTFNNVSNIEIGTYGEASDKPILDALIYQNPGVGGWTYISGGVWKKTFGASYYIRRLWVGSTNFGNLVSQRVVGTAKRRATGATLKGVAANPSQAEILAALNSSDIWFGGGPATSYGLFVYTGSASIDPPTYYEGIAFILSDGFSIGAVAGIHVENQAGIYCHDLHFRGNGESAIRLLAQNSNVRDVADCLFEDCTVTHPYKGAFASRILAELAPARRCKSSTVRRVYCDYSTHQDEMEPDLSYNFLSSIVDLFGVNDGSIGITVEACTAINGAHNGLAAHSIAMRTTPPSGCRMINNKVHFDSWHTYGRGINALDGDTLVAGNLIDGQNVRTQLGGSVKIIGNIWSNLRVSSRKADVSQWISFESYMYDTFSSGIGNERYLRIQPVDVQVANNTVYSPAGEAVKMSCYVPTVGEKDTTFSAGTVSIRNNIIHRPAGKFLITYEDFGRVIGQQALSSNCVYNSSRDDNKISWRNSSYRLNSAPGFSENVEDDPDLDEFHRPRATGVKRVGRYLGGKDFYGKQFYDPPNIGAVDDLSATPRYLLTSPPRSNQ